MSKNFKQWYAAKKAMQQRGTWRGNARHSVPQQEEGEPAAQRPRLWWERPNNELDVAPPLESPPEAQPTPGTSGGVGRESDSPDSLPELEGSPTNEGESCLTTVSLCLLGLSVTRL